MPAISSSKEADGMGNRSAARANSRSTALQGEPRRDRRTRTAKSARSYRSALAAMSGFALSTISSAVRQTAYSARVPRRFSRGSRRLAKAKVRACLEAISAHTRSSLMRRGEVGESESHEEIYSSTSATQPVVQSQAGHLLIPEWFEPYRCDPGNSTQPGATIWKAVCAQARCSRGNSSREIQVRFPRPGPAGSRISLRVNHL